VPNIRTTQFDPTLPRPSSGPSEGEIIGAGIQAFAQGVGAAEDTITRAFVQRKVMAASKNAAELQLSLQEEWATTIRNADADDDEVHTRFIEEKVKPQLSALGDDVKLPAVKKHLERLGLGITTQFAKSAFEDMAELRAVQAGVDFKSAVRSSSTIVLNDPDALEGQLELMSSMEETFIAEGGSRQTAIAMRAERERTLAMAAGKGAMNQSLEAGQEFLSSGIVSEILTGEQQSQLISYGTARDAAKATEARRINEGVARLATIETVEGVIENGGSVTPDMYDDLVDNEAYDTAEGAPQLLSMFRFLKAQETSNAAGAKIPFDVTTYREYWRRAGLPYNDPSRLTETEALDGATVFYDNARMGDLLKRVNGTQTQDGRLFNDASDRLDKEAFTLLAKPDPTSGIPDPFGVQRYNDYMLLAMPMVYDMQNRGFSTFDIFNRTESPVFQMLQEAQIEGGLTGRIAAFTSGLQGRDVTAPVITGAAADEATVDPATETHNEKMIRLRKLANGG
jgi:hypothetical protein